MLTVVSHEYDANRGIDHYVFDPGSMKVQVKVTIEGEGDPQVLLGVEGMAVQQCVTEPTWTVCRNEDIVQIALADHKNRS